MTTAIYLGVVVLPIVLLVGNLFRNGRGTRAGSFLPAAPKARVSQARTAWRRRSASAPSPEPSPAPAPTITLRTPSTPGWVPAPGYAAFPSAEPDAAPPVAQRLADKTCPDCAETVAAAVRVCPHCGFGVLTVQRERASVAW